MDDGTGDQLRKERHAKTSARCEILRRGAKPAEPLRLVDTRLGARFTRSMLDVAATATSSSEPDAVVRAYLVHVDRTLIAKNLGLTVEERFRQLMALQVFADELARAGRAARR